MNRNRALELVRRAMWHIAHNYWESGIVLLEMAYTEILELEERVRELEGRAQPATLVDQHTGSDLTPALLAESPRTVTALDWQRRKALPGNGRKL